VLRLRDLGAEPRVAGDQVLIQTEACALNFADSLLCAGTYQEHPPLPFTPGLEIAGTIIAAGPDAEHRPGARVAGAPLLPHGGLAEAAVARSADVFDIGDGDAAEAAARHVTYQTGWFALHHRARLQRGETLLVHAGAGGVGSAAIQLGVAAGARVLATAGGPDKVARCLELGAHLAFDHRATDFVDEVNRATDGLGADVVYDAVGGDTFTRSTRCIAWDGRIVVVGAASGTYAPARTNHAMVKSYGILGLNWGGYRTRRPDLVAQAHRAITALAAAGRVRPLVSRRLSLDEDVPGAIDDIVTGRTTGKVVVVTSGPRPTPAGSAPSS
jgi:NADPH2:quinone reductase